MIEKLKKQLLPLKGNERARFLRALKSYVYVYCEICDDNRRMPIYIGKGKSDRCFSHLNNLGDLTVLKNKKINDRLNENRPGIDILAYGLDNKTGGNLAQLGGPKILMC